MRHSSLAVFLSLTVVCLSYSGATLARDSVSGNAARITELERLVSLVPPAKTVFITSQRFNGDFGFSSGSGPSSACQDAAVAAGLAGNYVSWAGRFANFGPSKFSQDYSYINTRGEIVAYSWSGLTDSSLVHGIIYDEYGDPGFNTVWVGRSGPDGGPFSGPAEETNCAHWRSADPNDSAWTGSPYDYFTSGWSANRKEPCSFLLPFYCFER